MLKYFYIVFSFLLNQQLHSQTLNDWIKAGPKLQPRYFLINSSLNLCGVLKSVNLVNVDKMDDYLELPSCLLSIASDKESNIITFNIVGKKENSLIISREYFEDGNSFIKTYKAPIDEVTSLFGLRYKDGELMVMGPSLCSTDFSWEFPGHVQIEHEFSSNPTIPFKVSGVPEVIRYHVVVGQSGCYLGC